MEIKTQAIILAAGSGKRMRPISEATHKTLLKINGVSIISNIISKLLHNGVNTIIVVVGYKAQDVKAHVLEAFPMTDIQFLFNERFNETNNLVSLSMALEASQDRSDVIIIEADLIYEEDVIRKILASSYENAALVDRYRTGMDGTVVTVADNVITGVIPPHLQGSDFSFKDKYKTLNIYKFSADFAFGTFRDLLAFFTNSIKDSYYEVILGVIIYLKSGTINAEILNGEKWAEIDDPNDLQVAKFTFDENRKLVLDRSFGGFWNYPITDFCYLRNMYFPPSSMRSELKNNLDKTIYEYGSTQNILNQKMSFFLECKQEDVVTLNGISQIFPFIKTYFSDKTVLIPNPTFGEYNRIFPHALKYKDSVGFHLNDLMDQSADVVVFVNPNNPTGTVVPSLDICKYAQSYPEKYVIVDESFIDFSHEISVVELLKKEPLNNVIVIKSLSKCLGVAGLRIGFSFSTNNEFNSALIGSLPVWNMNSLAENFLEILLKYKPQLADSYLHVKRDREAFVDGLKSVPFIKQIFPSGGNFLLVKTDLTLKQEEGLIQYLLSKHSVYLKSVSEKLDDGQSWLRLAVHKPIENNRLVALFVSYSSIELN